MKSLSFESFHIFWVVFGASLLCSCYAACEPWVFRPSDNPVDDVKYSLEKKLQNGGAADLYDAMTAIVAVNHHPDVRNGTVHTFVEEMIGINHVISSCTDTFTLKIKSKSPPEYYITFNKADFAFAEGNVQNRPIWPVIVAKAAAALHQKYPDEKEVIKGDALLKDANDKLYECNEKSRYLCKISDLVSRFTGVSLRSTPRVIQSDHKYQETFDAIFEQSSRGPTIVFENYAPKYLIEHADKKDNEDGREYGQRTFHARKLDIHKHGESREMNYELKSISNSEIFKYKDIIDKDGGSRNIYVVYPA